MTSPVNTTNQTVNNRFFAPFTQDSINGTEKDATIQELRDQALSLKKENKKLKNKINSIKYNKIKKAEDKARDRFYNYSVSDHNSF